MANTFTTNFNLTKPEIGGANDTWGTLVNTNFVDLDTQLYRKADKNDQKGVTHTLTFASGSTNVTTNVARGFASYAVGDKISVTHSGNAANKGTFYIEGITDDIILDLKQEDGSSEPSFASEAVLSVVAIVTDIHTLATVTNVDFTTVQKDAIVDGSTALSRPQGVKSLTIAAGGSSYSGSGTLAASGSNTTFSGAYTVASGAIATVTITNPGSGYTSAPTIVSTPTLGSAGSSGSVTSTVYTLNDLTFAGSASLPGDLAVTGDVAVTGDIAVTGAITSTSLTGAIDHSLVTFPTGHLISTKIYQRDLGVSSTTLNNGTAAMTNSITVACTSGRTYTVEFSGTISIGWYSSTNEDEYNITGALYEPTGSVNKGNGYPGTSRRKSNFGYKDIAGTAGEYGWYSTNVNLDYSFTASSTGNRYFVFGGIVGPNLKLYLNASNSQSPYCYKVKEYKGDNLTAGSD